VAQRDAARARVASVHQEGEAQAKVVACPPISTPLPSCLEIFCPATPLSEEHSSILGVVAQELHGVRKALPAVAEELETLRRG